MWTRDLVVFAALWVFFGIALPHLLLGEAPSDGLAGSWVLDGRGLLLILYALKDISKGRLKDNKYA